MIELNQRGVPVIRHSARPVLEPRPDCEWAEKMVLNPAIIDDPDTDELHMLFRASGAMARLRLSGQDLPYPIYLGYAVSRDDGVTWEADFSRPALEPRLCYDRDGIFTVNGRGEPGLNYANGELEDPRLFRMEGRLYLSAAVRVFPVGAYWQCVSPEIPAPDTMPDWHCDAVELGRAVTDDVTVTVLYEVDLEALKRRQYETAFRYLTRITDPERGDNRDAFLFPERWYIDGKWRYVALHRSAESFDGVAPHHSIWVAAEEDLYDLGSERAQHRLLAQPLFDWEADRVGASWAPLRLDERSWLVPYHGKKDNVTGYTQSFMIVEAGPDGWPVIKHRCPERLLYAQLSWECSDLLYCPCIFTCSGVVRDGELIMGYGAADERVGIARCDFAGLVEFVRGFDAAGVPCIEKSQSGKELTYA